MEVCAELMIQHGTPEHIRSDEIDLERFERTDPSNLITPLGFTFLEEPQSFLLRNARYVNAD